MKDHNNFNVAGWMFNRLGLSGNEVMVYAIIYGFSQDEESKYFGSCKYMADSLGISKRQVFTIFENLVKKGFIKKIEKWERNLKFCEYQANPDFFPKNDKNGGSEKTSSVMKFPAPGGDEKTSPVVKNNHRGDEKISPGGDEETSPNIKSSYINDTTTTAEQPDSSEKAPPDGATAAVVNLSPEDIKQAILAIDRSLLSYKKDFYSRAADFMALHCLDKSYLKWLYKQVELSNPGNFDGFFFTIFFAENMAEKYKISKLPPKPPPTEIKCQVCGAVHDKELDKCPLCSLPKDSSPGDIALFKKLKVLPPDKRNEYLQKADDIYKKFDPFIPSEIEKRKNMIKNLENEFGVGVKNEEPSLRHHT